MRAILSTFFIVLAMICERRPRAHNSTVFSVIALKNKSEDAGSVQYTESWRYTHFAFR